VRHFVRSGLAISSALVAAAALVGAAVGSEGAVPKPPSGAQLEALSKPPTTRSIASQRIYFVMPDRYANGDPSNDEGGEAGSRVRTGFDPTDDGWYHGGDLKGLTGGCTDPKVGLRRVKDLGFTAIWVTPVVKQRFVQASSAAYHGYWGLDFTTVDPHLGTDADFAAFVDCAHSLGLKVYLDVVTNHTADVVQLSGGSSYSDLPYRDCKGKVFNPTRYAGGKTFPCLNLKSFPRTPILLPEDRNAKKPAWLNNVLRYHNRGDIDFSSCDQRCAEQGDFFGLDDLFTEQPVVARGLADIYASWITRFKVDGFRVDTARHVDRAFFKVWVPRIQEAARAAGVSDFQIFGEVFVTDSLELSGFMRYRSLPNVIDFPLWDSAVRYVSGAAGARAVSIRFADDDYFNLPNGVAFTPTTFLGNHDTGRAARLIQSQLGATGDELLKRVELGYSLLYLVRGAPVVYYGDEVGMIGAGGDKQARQDMFPTRVRYWQQEERLAAPPIGTGSSFDVVGHPLGEHLRELGALREANPALATGSSAVRLAREGLLVLSRFDLDARREYVVALNAAPTAARVTVTTATPGASWQPLLGTEDTATSNTAGRLDVSVPALSAVVLRSSSTLPERKPGAVTVKVGQDDFSELWRVQATVAGADPSTVTLAMRRDGASTWKRLGIDQSPPYRAFVDLRGLRKGTRVHFVAVVRSSSGGVVTSRVSSVTIPRK
jgi:glycosidase